MHDRPITKSERVAVAAILVAAGIAMLASGCWSSSSAPPVPVPPATGDPMTPLQVKQRSVISAAQRWYPSVEIRAVMWHKCGTENSWWFGNERAILLCDEMEAHPGAGVFYAAHESGHAITWQLAGTLDEEAADEVGALLMIRLGLVAELAEAAKYEMDKDETRHVLHDGHPAEMFRAWNLICLAEGSTDGSDADCRALYETTRMRWELRLGAPQYVPIFPAPGPTDPVE